MTAQTLLAKVELNDALLELISHLCYEFDVTSLRADIVMHKASRALAALDAREQVTTDDVKNAAQLVLPHRLRRKPFEQLGLDQQQLDNLMDQTSPPECIPENQPKPEPAERPNPDLEQSDSATENDQVAPGKQQEAAKAIEPLRNIAIDSVSGLISSGRRSTRTSSKRGRKIRSEANEKPENIAVGSSLHSAVLRNPDNQAKGKIQVTKNDLHQQVLESKNANLIILIVDASGSMAAQQRMEAAKGAVLSLLTDAYQKRDQVAVISFRGAMAETLLAPTRSIELAQQSLQQLPTGGRTPLPHALIVTLEMLKKNNDANNLQPLLVLLCDGKANVALNPGQDPWQETVAIAELISENKVPALVIDTEISYLQLGRAKQLAQALGGQYLTLEDLSAENLTLTIRRSITST